jgi:hypothetical protein
MVHKPGLFRFSLKGCQILAGGRSLAKASGARRKEFSNPEGCQKTVAGFRYERTCGILGYAAEKRDATLSGLCPCGVT